MNGRSWWLSDKESTFPVGEGRKLRFSPWVRKIPWKRLRQPAHSSILAWTIPWTEEPGRLQSRGVTKSLMQLKLLSMHAHSMDIVQSEQTPASTDADWLRSRLSEHIQLSARLHADSAKTKHQVLVG